MNSLRCILDPPGFAEPTSDQSAWELAIMKLGGIILLRPADTGMPLQPASRLGSAQRDHLCRTLLRWRCRIAPSTLGLRRSGGGYSTAMFWSSCKKMAERQRGSAKKSNSLRCEHEPVLCLAREAEEFAHPACDDFLLPLRERFLDEVCVVVAGIACNFFAQPRRSVERLVFAL